MAKLVFGVIGATWGILGLMLLVFPIMWKSSVTRKLREPGFRFAMMQGIVLGGIFLVIGTTGFQGFGLWGSMGFLSIAIASFLLGSSSNTRDHFLGLAERWPLWVYRLSGLMMVSLAVLLGADLILNGS